MTQDQGGGRAPHGILSLSHRSRGLSVAMLFIRYWNRALRVRPTNRTQRIDNVALRLLAKAEIGTMLP